MATGEKSRGKQAEECFKDEALRALVGTIVLTRYNNKRYRVDDIDFENSPKSTFEAGGRQISFMEYY